MFLQEGKNEHEHRDCAPVSLFLFYFFLKKQRGFEVIRLSFFLVQARTQSAHYSKNRQRRK